MGSKYAWKVTFAFFFCSPMIWQDIFFLIDYVFWKYLVISCMKIKIRYYWLYCATSNVTMGFWINSIRSILFYASVISRDMSSVLVQTTTWVNHEKLVKTLGEKIAGLELVRVPRVPGTRGIFGQYCPAPADFGNFTT